MKAIFAFLLLCAFLCGGELSKGDEGYVWRVFDRAVALPSFCEARQSEGALRLDCEGQELSMEALRIEIGCYESARTFVDLLGDEPRGLKVEDLNGGDLELRLPFSKGALRLKITPAYSKEALDAVVLCADDIAINIYGKDKKLVEKVARKLKF